MTARSFIKWPPLSNPSAASGCSGGLNFVQQVLQSLAASYANLCSIRTLLSSVEESVTLPNGEQNALWPTTHTKRDYRDRDRINVHEDYELQYWTKELGVTPEKLKQTVEKVGVMATDVRKALGK